MKRNIIKTSAAPAAIGTYSQAVRAGNTLYVSGQIGMHPATLEVVSKNFIDQARQVFKNLKAIVEAAEADMSKVVKLTVYLINLSNFNELNSVMSEFMVEPYPARAAVEVSRLPKDVLIEIDAIVVFD